MEIAIDHNYNLRLADPLSRKQIEYFARFIRKEFDVKGFYVDILKILEINIPNQDENFSFCLYKKTDEMGIKHGYYDVEKNCIFMREDIYRLAFMNDGFSRFTIAHEIGHYCLIQIFGKPYYVPLENIEKYSDPTLKSMDPEWQADVFAGEFLCCSEIIKGSSVKEIETKCRVTEQCAKIAWKINNSILYTEYYRG